MTANQGPVGARLLLVEDDLQLSLFLETALISAGYRLLIANSASAALSQAEQYAPDGILLDLGLPDGDGLEVLRKLRRWSRAPVLILSARGQEQQKVQLLDAGADDYLTKPFGFEELMARLRALLRRGSQPLAAGTLEKFRCGNLELDGSQRQVTVAGAEVHLTPIEFKLLLCLCRHPGRIVTHKQLLLDVWGPHHTESSNYLRVYMTHLRRKLGPAAALLRTEAGVGYGLRCPENEA